MDANVSRRRAQRYRIPRALPQTARLPAIARLPTEARLATARLALKLQRVLLKARLAAQLAAILQLRQLLRTARQQHP